MASPGFKSKVPIRGPTTSSNNVSSPRSSQPPRSSGEGKRRRISGDNMEDPQWETAWEPVLRKKAILRGNSSTLFKHWIFTKNMSIIISININTRFSWRLIFVVCRVPYKPHLASCVGLDQVFKLAQDPSNFDVFGNDGNYCFSQTYVWIFHSSYVFHHL
jgi:hypothetical protein